MPRYKKNLGALSMSDAELLAAALFGLERQRTELDEKMAEIRRRIGARAGRPARKSVSMDAAAAPAPKKRTLSAAARRRIAEAQRKRWAALKGHKAELPAPKKRKLSAAGRKRIIEATKRRWAEFRSKQAAASKRGSAS